MTPLAQGRSARSGHDGFTILEFMMVIAIVGILTALAIPSFRSFSLNAKRSEVLNDLVSSINLARSESQKQGRVFSVCPTSDYLTCSAGQADWGAGWIVFLNVDNPDAVPPNLDPDGVAPDDTVLEVHRVEGTGHLVVGVFQGNSPSTSIKPFQRRSLSGTLTYCDSRGAAAARAVVVQPSGRASVESRSLAGTPLVCP